MKQLSEPLRPILEDLRAVGFSVDTLADLRHNFADYSLAVPILTHWLDKTSDPLILEELVRSLTVPNVPPEASRRLLELYTNRSTPHQLRWAIGNAFEVSASEQLIPELIQIALDRSYGTARQMIVLALAKNPNPDSIDTLVKLLDDEQVNGHAIMALGSMAYAPARSRLETFLNHPKEWKRRKAELALKKIDSALQKSQDRSSGFVQ